MRALVLAPDPTETPGALGRELGSRGIELDCRVIVPDVARPEHHVGLPTLDDYDLVVAMGAPWSVDDTVAAAWVAEELALLRAAHARGVPVLGVCFGAQALAVALGGRVERAPVAEVGWYEVDTDDPSVIGPGPWFQWHGDRFSVPPGARELARSAVGPQAFVLGRSLGVQFHPEVDEDHLAGWIEPELATDPQWVAAGADPADVLAATPAAVALARPQLARLVDAWLTGAAAGVSG